MNRNQFIKLVALVLLTFLPSLALSIKFQPIFINSVNSIAPMAPFIFSFAVAIVIYLIKYVDSISSKLRSLTNDSNSNKINDAIVSLKVLNQEGISNLILLFVLLTVTLVTGNFSNTETLTCYQVVSISIKLSSILLMVFVTIQQAMALHIAMEYRVIVEAYKIK